MCGIAGVYNFKTDRPVSEESIKDMISVINYRGPDGEGVFKSGSVGLGHKRLTIIDTSERSNQPMTSQHGSQTICYNGEVYNYLELTTYLQSVGIELRTSSDTEVLLELLRLEGPKALEKLNGMFAFAYWDESDQALMLVRDRVGIKPLYYQETDQGIVFASEIKSILALSDSSNKVNRSLIDGYMSLGYCTGNNTLFEGIKKVPPGHYIVVKNNKIELRQYWNMVFDKSIDLGEEYYIKKAHDLFEDSVKLQLRSDVPLGVFLSGGIDSSAVVAMMWKLGAKDIKTFSVAWDYGNEFDETQYARKIAKQFNTDHTEYFMTHKEFKDFLPEYIRHMDEPVTEAAAISLYYLAMKTKEKVTVVLSGEGSDEVFGGYGIYRSMQLVEHYKKIPSIIHKVINPLMRSLGHSFSKYADLSETPLEQSYAGVSFYDTKQKHNLYSQSFKIEAAENDVFKTLAPYYGYTMGQDLQSKMQYIDIKTWLVDDLLIKADRMSMAASLELRVPFLDHRFLELAANMPSQYRNKKNQSKYIIKKAMEPYLDDEILYRKKQGFPTPLAIMFQGDLKDFVSDIIDSDLAHSREYFNPQEVKRLLTEHIEGIQDHHKILWQLLVLELWFREFIDKENIINKSSKISH
ncbi:MAG: asparagine synthase (glutamine-hydrolyzing) [Bermanella sp.]|jgi:asparagine synthase (glutamine-hydrolysing)